MKASDTLIIDTINIEPENLVKLKTIMKANDEPANRAFTMMLNAVNDPNNTPCPELSKFPALFKAWIKESGATWLFGSDPRRFGVAYAVLDCEYRPPNQRYREDASVTIEFGYNTKMTYRTWTVTLHKSDMRQTVEKIMQRHGLQLPNEDSQARYDRLYERFTDFGSQQAEQFWVRGNAAAAERGRFDWWSADTLNMMAKGRPSKAVLDYGADTNQRDNTRTNISSNIVGRVVKIPTHPMLPIFSLIHHKTAWVNVGDMSPYKYEEGLGDRLILPPTHRKLIGALVSNLEVLKMESEVEGKSRMIRAKSASNIILAMGRAGTGKTMTAEVYSEEIKRPLYEVNSGQLGTDAETIEKELHAVLERSVRLRMPLLINEADVFIQKRGVSLEQNAVVSVFLRHLEYHNGLVFMTTNRPEDVDEAIKNRCIAEITYKAPQAPERALLWVSTLEEFNCALSKVELKKVVDVFPDVVGRDIVKLIQLTSRYCTATGEEFCLQAMIDCSIFKSIELAEGVKVTE